MVVIIRLRYSKVPIDLGVSNERLVTKHISMESIRRHVVDTRLGMPDSSKIWWVYRNQSNGDQWKLATADTVEKVVLDRGHCGFYKVVHRIQGYDENCFIR